MKTKWLLRALAVAVVLTLFLPRRVSANTFDVGPDELRRVGHLLNRAAFGPTFREVKRVLKMGVDAWIEEQLHPQSIDESENAALARHVAALMEKVASYDERHLVAIGDKWLYQKGTRAPPANWKTALDFDHSRWQEGPSGFGYSDDDDRTVLKDMRGRYTSVFIRHQFTLSKEKLAGLSDLMLRINYDDSFVAYLNGTEVARSNVPGRKGRPVPHTALATNNHEAGNFEDFDLTPHKHVLKEGGNVLAIQGHNVNLQSSDLSLIPQLTDRKPIPGTTRLEIKGLEELKGLAHIYSFYSRRQLQTVLALFWENHFTTDADKVAEYLDKLRNSDASDALTTVEARQRAAWMEHDEFEFFRKNALGNFGDLLRYSATSPTMLIYLDNVLNVRGNANENYAREILELHTYGVDNGYHQVDIEQLAKCFTGWGVGTYPPERAGDPHARCSVQVEDTVIILPAKATELSGKDWRYRKGTSEPPSAWKSPSFDDSSWQKSPAGIGYGDDDDATVLRDMRNRYTTVYLRKTVELADPGALKNLILKIDVDDGFVAYLNGSEAVRFNAPGKPGDSVAFNARASDSHEAGEPLFFNLSAVRDQLVAGTNVLAIQVLNISPSSSDLTAIPSFINRELLQGSIENGDSHGVWAFHFFPNLHNSTEEKTLFKGMEFELTVPGGRSETKGIQDAEDAVRRILDRPSTPTFVCSKLIQRFVRDEIDFRKPSEGPYAGLLKRCIEAWNSTKPKGNITHVMKTILTSKEFWSERAYQAKVRDPFEYIASTVRVLDAQSSGVSVVDNLQAMGMELFTRDDPDGWPETGTEWIDTGSFQSRMVFAQTLTANLRSRRDLYWDAAAFLKAHGLDDADKIVAFFNDLMFQGTLTEADQELVKDFLTTDDAGNPLPLRRERADFADRVRRTLGLTLSLPQWQFQ